MKERNAYFTVEAAMVIPLVVGVILFAVYMLLFQYNRCLLEQDAGMLAVWGSTLSGETETLEWQIKNRLSGVGWDKYVAWEMETLRINVKNNSCSVGVAGYLRIPEFTWNFREQEDAWCSDVRCEYKRLRAPEFVRMCNKEKR